MYGNHFRAIPRGVLFVPEEVPVKPRMVSRQRGWVVAVDEPSELGAGRVAVQFDWLYQGEGASPSHCWLPLAPELVPGVAGALSDGTEVLVSFIEGDPDRPMISAFLDAPASVESVDESSTGETRGPSVADPFLLSAIREAEPLVLLCLLPEGGPFSPCSQPLCTCRMLIRRGASVAR